ncbi:ABC transporter permease [Bacteroidota bacterium]
MHKILIFFKREYLAAVKTKSFIISIILVPILMAGSFIAMIIMEKNQDTDDKKFAIIDRSGILTDVLKDAAEFWNTNEIFDKETGDQSRPAYILDFIDPNSEDPFTQRLELSDKVRSKEYHAFIEIGSKINMPRDTAGENYLRYYSEHGFMDDVRYWFSNVINNHLRQKRIEAMNLDPEVAFLLDSKTYIESLGLATIDKKTGESVDASRTNEMQAFIVPYAVVLLMFMLTLMSAIPLLTAVMEEKSEKIAEVLLGSMTPFQFMAGKVLGGIGVGLTVAAFYVGGGAFIVSYMDVGDIVPVGILPWFFVFLVLFILMVGSGMAALGATCNDNKDAQSLQFPAMFPVILPMFAIIPLIQNPTGAFATTLSFIPPITPTVMMIRMATPVTIPLWQPIVGLLGVVLYTIFSVWIGARIFRTAILIQGQKPSLANLIKYAFKS